MLWSVFANEQICTDSDAPVFSQLRERSYTTYPDAQFSLTQEWRQILQKIIETQQPYDIYPSRLDNQAICAAYLYEFSQVLWWPTAPSRFGMFHPDDRTVCSARELPYCYWYRGGEVMVDIGDVHGPALKSDPLQYPLVVTQEQFLRWYASTRDYQSYLWDITFLYWESDYLHMIGVYGNYNSHIGKHLGIHKFEIGINDLWENISNQLMMRQWLGCSEQMWNLVEPIRKHVPMQLNAQPMRVVWNDDVIIENDQWDREWYILQPWDRITYSDILVTHFWEWEKAQSLLQMMCEEDFYPIAVVSIGEQWIGKE